MILTDVSLHNIVNQEDQRLEDWETKPQEYLHIVSESFNKSEQIQPASIDLKLGLGLKVYSNPEGSAVTLGSSKNHAKFFEDVDLDEEGYYVLESNQFYLGRTEEKVMVPRNLVAKIDGRSSVGRCGVLVHATAGYIDPGFYGTITLEMWHVLPDTKVRIKPGSRLCQLIVMRGTEPCRTPYGVRGRYQGQTDPEASKF